MSLNILYFFGYEAVIKYNPEAGTILPHSFLSKELMRVSIDSGLYFDIPISNNDPTILRTMWYRKLFEVISIYIRLLFLEILIDLICLIALLAEHPDDLKQL